MRKLPDDCGQYILAKIRPHAVLAGLFGRRPYPEPQILVALETIQTEEPPIRHCSLNLGVSIINNGRGLAEQLFLGVEMKSPPYCELNFEYRKESWAGWETGKDNRIRFTMISKSFPPLPPGSENVVLTIKLNLQSPETGDIVMDLICGSGNNGPGSARSIILPAKVMTDAIEHYLHDYPEAALKEHFDNYHNAKIKECLAP